MRRWLLMVSAMAAVAAVAVVLGVPGVGHAGPHAARVCAWQTFPVEENSVVGDVEALSGSDVWVVGDGDWSEFPNVTPLLVHWDGSRWERSDVRLPSMSVSAVSGSSGSDVWAVGANTNGGTATLHWDGVRWRYVPTPNVQHLPRQGLNNLTDVVALSPTDAWAAGYLLDGEELPLLLHWNGRNWKRVTLPVAGLGSLSAVAASSPTSVWAVGPIRASGAVALHWDGHSWQKTLLPPPAPELVDVTAASDGSAWAVGFNGGHPPRRYDVRWVHNTWQTAHIFDIVGASMTTGVLYAETPTRVWASQEAKLRLWDGTQWRPGPTVPFASQPYMNIGSLTASPEGTLWLSLATAPGYEPLTAGTDQPVIASYSCRG
jgi:hypothetical protein